MLENHWVRCLSISDTKCRQKLRPILRLKDATTKPSMRHQQNLALALPGNARILPPLHVRVLQQRMSHTLISNLHLFSLPSNEKLVNLVSPHIESFNYLLSEGLHLAIADIARISIQLPGQSMLSIWVEDAQVGLPFSSNAIKGEV